MKILILTQWYPPEPALLIQDLAQTLQERGHEVTVFTGFPNYPAGNLYPGYRLRWHQREIVAGIQVIRVPLYPEHSQSGIRRALNYFSFALSSALLGPWLVPAADVIFVYHPPLTIALPAFVLSRLWQVPFVYQIQDMWPETLSATGMLNNGPLLRLIGSFAQWVYTRAHTILVISPGFRQNLLTKGVPANKVRVISNWVEFEDILANKPDTDLAVELGLAGHFNVMFAGNMGGAQSLQTILESAALCQDLPKVQFVLVGDGIELPKLRKMAETQNLSNVRFLGRYPPQAMPSLFALAEVLLVHLKDDPLFRITIPHKVLTYLGAGKPIIAALAGDAASVVTESGAGISCPPQDPVALAQSVRLLYELPADERLKMGANGLSAARTQYSRCELVGKIEAVLRDAVVATPK